MVFIKISPGAGAPSGSSQHHDGDTPVRRGRGGGLRIDEKPLTLGGNSEPPLKIRKEGKPHKRKPDHLPRFPFFRGELKKNFGGVAFFTHPKKST